VIGGELAEDAVWVELLAKVDADGSGEIDLKEFQQLMSNAL
jgi:Ca2+-binding EF-hand superfamily protein